MNDNNPKSAEISFNMVYIGESSYDFIATINKYSHRFHISKYEEDIKPVFDEFKRIILSIDSRARRETKDNFEKQMRSLCGFR